MCIKKEISLVCIPYWYDYIDVYLSTAISLISLIDIRWDGQADSLSSTLHELLPDVFPKTASSTIPPHPPDDFKKVCMITKLC